ncbi:SRPBCC family protein [Chitinibacter sp. ZOR0017]|uniref:SRPBCC family protein n=1 Tax=Chitinibacter sp. ZOR0017 TaxID=1339254 RepID=UPI000647E6F1|nr:SRPBCC family protein [Chitinibacter sp. ZOR0017]
MLLVQRPTTICPSQPPRRLSSNIWHRLSFAVLSLMFTGYSWGTELASVKVEVSRQEQTLQIRGRYQVAANPDQVFAVLTDYERMQQFVPGLLSSKVLAREGKVLRLQQQSRHQLGPFSVVADSISRIELRAPEEILCQSLQNSQGEFNSSTRIQGLGERSEVIFEASWRPTNSVLLNLGSSAVRARVQEQLASMQQEIQRRYPPLSQLQAKAP